MGGKAMLQRFLTLGQKITLTSSKGRNVSTQLITRSLTALAPPISTPQTPHTLASQPYVAAPPQTLFQPAIQQPTPPYPPRNTPQKLQLNPWQQTAIKKLLAEQQSCPETPIRFLFAIDGINIFAKDESKQPTQSHKHRLARSLFLHALRNGLIDQTTQLVEASSGGTACSEAYFAKLLGVRYTAVVSKNTPQHKLDAIKAYNGIIEECEPGQDKAVAAKLTEQRGWYFIDQFAHAGIATDKENNIASEITSQFKKNNTPMPRYVVCGVGTGGTSATLGGYFQQHGFDKTEVIVGDPENSAFSPAFKTSDRSVTTNVSSRIGGIGRPRVEPGFDPTKIAEVIEVPDAGSIAACHFLQHVSKLCMGGSTGTNLFVCFELVERMRQKGEKGSILMFLFDRGELYEDTYYNPVWLKQQKMNIQPYLTYMMDIYGNFSDNVALHKDPIIPYFYTDRFRPCPSQMPRLFTALSVNREEKQSGSAVMISSNTFRS
jgi:cysteine synthase A